MQKQEEIGLIVSPNPKAGQVAAELLKMYPARIVSVRFSANMPVQSSLEKYKNISDFVAVGGDGASLWAMRIAYEIARLRRDQKPPRIFGLNCGHIGALSNPLGDITRLTERMGEANYQLINPLEVKTTFREKIIYHTFFNEVILRPYANLTQLRIVWQDDIWYQKNIRGGIMVATKIGENAMNICNYTGAEPILPIPDGNHWRMSTLHAMPNDPTSDKPFQSIVPSSTNISVDVINPYNDRNAQIMGDYYYNEGEQALKDAQGYQIGAKVKMLFVDKIRITSAKMGVLLARERVKE